MGPNSLVVVPLLLMSLALGGCSWASSTLESLFLQRPQALLPAGELYQQGENDLQRRRYEDARGAFRKIVERHPQSNYAPKARFLIGEAYYREGEFDKAIKEFDGFLSFYPRHEIADLVQYRLAMSYYDQMKPVEQDQSVTGKAMNEFRKLVREYPDSRYASEALAKADVCRGRLAQKELWVASYYQNQGNYVAARQRLEFVLKEYQRTLVIPETLYRLGEVQQNGGQNGEAQATFRRLAAEYPYTEWGRRAAQRIRTATTR
jgi:outer membrane protein assembly factor BamD